MPNRIAIQTSQVLYVSILLFAACLLLNAFHLEEAGRSATGITLLLTGWLGFFAGFVAWFANPLLFWSWYLFYCGQFANARFIAVLSLATALTFLGAVDVPQDEIGNRAKITGYAIGFYLWLASMVTIVIGTFLVRKTPKVDE